MQNIIRCCPEIVRISMAQGQGTVCYSVVKAGMTVECGELIGVSGMSGAAGFFCIYASVSGTVIAIERQRVTCDSIVEIVVINRLLQDGQTRIDKVPAGFRPADRLQLMCSGIIPLAAGYVMQQHRAVVVNALGQSAVIMNETGRLLMAVKALLDFESRAVLIFYIDDQRSVALLSRFMADYFPAELQQRITFSVNALPDTAAKEQWCFDCSELCALYDWLYEHRPFISVFVEAAAEGVSIWCEVPVGMMLVELLEKAGLYGAEKQDAYAGTGCIVEGTLMAGISRNPETAAVSVSTRKLYYIFPQIPSETVCVRCGACRTACPKRLKPDKLIRRYQPEKAALCTGCGICSYVCPSGLRLKEYIGRGQVILSGGRKEKKQEYIELSERCDIQPLQTYGYTSPFIRRDVSAACLYHIFFYMMSATLTALLFLSRGVLFKETLVLMAGTGLAGLLLHVLFCRQIRPGQLACGTGWVVYAWLFIPWPELKLLTVVTIFMVALYASSRIYRAAVVFAGTIPVILLMRWLPGTWFHMNSNVQLMLGGIPVFIRLLWLLVPAGFAVFIGLRWDIWRWFYIYMPMVMCVLSIL